MKDFDYNRYLDDLRAALGRMPLSSVRRIADALYEAYCGDRTIFIFGNGGSAALASHLACDLGKGTHCPAPTPADLSGVKRLKVMSLTDNVPALTAWSNDASYEDVFAEQMVNFIQPRDVAFAISGSGNSPNVLKALALARRVGAATVGLTGFQGGKMKDLLDCGIVVPADNMQQVEDCHLVLAHLIFLDLRERIARSAVA